MTKPAHFTIRNAAGSVLWSDYALNGEHAMDAMEAQTGAAFNATHGMTIERRGGAEYRDNPEA